MSCGMGQRFVDAGCIATRIKAEEHAAGVNRDSFEVQVLKSEICKKLGHIINSKIMAKL